MLLLIDGYNLLHASDIFADPGAVDESPEGQFEATREALIGFVAEAVGEKRARRTTIVFDAADAPPGLPHSFRRQGVMIRFARRQQSADDLIGELIEASRQPKQLLVVSSDHAVQRMARQAGASYVDSETWFAGQRRAIAERIDEAHPASDPVRKLRQGELSDEEVDRWVDEFRGDDAPPDRRVS